MASPSLSSTNRRHFLILFIFYIYFCFVPKLSLNFVQAFKSSGFYFDNYIEPYSASDVNQSKIVFVIAGNRSTPALGTDECGDTHFRCGNSICVELEKLCDGHDDCGDFTDETQCSK
ncbi:hypothetical protein Avbf_02502 [Armadillidium vulgare]|nr:hypothetical protein Avbf_02502 [Armadillidium vulgare]